MELLVKLVPMFWRTENKTEAVHESTSSKCGQPLLGPHFRNTHLLRKGEHLATDSAMGCTQQGFAP